MSVAEYYRKKNLRDPDPDEGELEWVGCSGPRDFEEEEDI